MTRRQAIQAGVLGFAGAAAVHLAPASHAAQADRPILQLGLLTDVHYADKPPRGSRHYRDALPKLQQALQTFVDHKVQAVLQLGDLIDAHATVPEEEQAVREVASLFRDSNLPYHFVMGNHCLQLLSKRRYAELAGCRAGHYVTDVGPLRIIVLDANYRADGVAYDAGNFEWTDCFIPQEQLDWLGNTLAGSNKPCIILTHQRLDPDPQHTVANHEAVRQVIAEAGGQRVRAVLQGHFHRNSRTIFNDIPYIVLRGIIEGAGLEENAYAILRMYDDGSIRINGFGRQDSYEL